MERFWTDDIKISSGDIRLLVLINAYIAIGWFCKYTLYNGIHEWFRETTRLNGLVKELGRVVWIPCVPIKTFYAVCLHKHLFLLLVLMDQRKILSLDVLYLDRIHKSGVRAVLAVLDPFYVLFIFQPSRTKMDGPRHAGLSWKLIGVRAELGISTLILIGAEALVMLFEGNAMINI